MGDAVLRLLRLAPVFINIAALAVLYAVMPNRRPHPQAVLVAATVGGITWQLLQWGYVSLQFGVARYSAIYGALAQVPVTLVWLYLSWAVILAGAEVAAVYELGAVHGPRLPGWAIGVALLLRAAESFRGGGGGVDPHLVAGELRLSTEDVAQVAEGLRAGGMLAAIEDSPRYLLARDPATIDLAQVRALLEPIPLPPGADPRLARLVEQSREHRSLEEAMK